MSEAADGHPPAPRTYLIISQVYVPDPASVGQHIADAAAELVRRGYRVRVYAAARGYDDPSLRFARSELRAGVEIRRLPLSSFGKSSIAVRLAAQVLFVLQATVRGLLTPGLCAVMVSTSPPFCGIAGAFISRIRGIPLKYWLMDLNPDQMIALRKLAPHSPLARIFHRFNRWTLRQASDVVMLDRFMSQRIQARIDVAAKTHIIPPWPHEDSRGNLRHADNPFRAAHGLGDRFVLMYSGNHSPANPIDTILDAVAEMRDEPRFLFMSIGGGTGKMEVARRIGQGAANIRSLPYQPVDQLRYSLSAADVHVVSIGNDVVGIVHPCKVYGAMSHFRPILLLGPSPSHVSDIIEAHRIGWHVAHGDVAGAVRVLRQMLAMPASELALMGQRAAAVINGGLSQGALTRRFCDVLELGLQGSRGAR